MKDVNFRLSVRKLEQYNTPNSCVIVRNNYN